MKKIIIYILISLTMNGIGQNLVLNPSFEDTLACPSSWTQIDKCKDWTQPLPISTTDYFNTCWPNYYVFFASHMMNAHTGNAFAGICVYDYIDYREYLIGKLNSTLEKDSFYQIEFYTMPNFYNLCNIQNIGIYFSNNKITQSVAGVLNVIPQFEYNITIINDSLKWNKITGKIKATGIEQYFIVGNFKSNINTINNCDTQNCCEIYYYFDDFSIKKITSPDTILPPSDTIVYMQIPNVFTPNGDHINDEFRYQHAEDWDFTTQIFNRWGAMIYSNSESKFWDGTYQGKEVPAGVYFYMVQAMAKLTGEVKNYKGSVTVVRE